MQVVEMFTPLDIPCKQLLHWRQTFCEYRKDDDCSQHYQISQDYNIDTVNQSSKAVREDNLGMIPSKAKYDCLIEGKYDEAC